MPSTARTTLNFERTTSQSTTVVRLIGWLRQEHLEVKAQIQCSKGEITLDLAELTLISAEGVRFLSHCVTEGISIAHASPYVSGGMARERNTADQQT